MRSSSLARLLIVGRLGLVLSTAFVLASIANWFNYRSYWHGTIRRVQTVDFNLLSHTLPTRLSYLLLNQEKEEVQRTLNSNYGFFGMVITDCLIAETDCSNQQIIYKTDSVRDWAQNLANPEIKQQILAESPFNILRDPPSLWTEGSFSSPRKETLDATGKVNQGQIIGRVYYIRGGSPEFWQDYANWLQKLPTSFLSDSGASKYYALTTGLLLTQGLMAWWFFERILLFKRGQQAKLEQDNQRLLEEASQLEQEYQSRLVKVTNLLQQKEQAFEELSQQALEQEQQQTELQTDIDVLESKLIQNAQERQERIRQLEELRQILKLERQEQTLTQEQLQQRQQEIDQLSENLNTTERERGVTQQELEGRQHELAESKQREQQAKDRAMILEQSIAEFREKQQIAEEKHQNAIKESINRQFLFEKKNQELTEEKNRIIAEQNNNLKELNFNLEYLRELEVDNQKLYREKEQLKENWRIEKQQLKEKLQEVIANCQSQEEKIGRLKVRLDDVKHQPRKQSNNDIFLLEKNYKTVYALLLEVEEQYDDIFQIWDSAKKSAKVLKVKPSNDVYIAFEVLAHTGRDYFNRLSDGTSMGAAFWDQAFRDRDLPNVYRPDESEATMNKYGKERIFTHGQITQHLTLKLGSDNYFQIYFEVNRDVQKIEIGYCGKHLSIVSYS